MPMDLRSMRAVLIALAGVIAAQACAAQALAENPQVAERRAAERKQFTDAEIIAGFFKLAFGAELHVAGRVDRIRKYEVPVRVYIDGRTKPDRRGQLADVVADIQRHIAHLDIAVTDSRSSANVVVRLVRDRDLGRALRLAYGRGAARRIQRSLEPQCLSGFRKDGEYRIVHSDVFLVVDAGTFTFFDCAFEELLQALGPINDDSSIPWTMFNDDVQMGYFGLYDQYILNILYHPRIRAGMTRQQVQELLPEILPDVRSFVSEANKLPAP
jgi:hypothetical protein